MKQRIDETWFSRMLPVLWCGLFVVSMVATNRPACAQSADDAVAEAPDAQDEGAVTDQPDRVQQILAGLDPALLNLSGAELDVEVVGDQLILRGNEDDLKVIELLVTILEQTTKQKELRVVTITEKDAKDIASSLEKPLQQIFADPNQRPEYELSITALSSRILLVSALPKQIDFITDLIKQVDETEDIELPPSEQLVFPIKHRRASEVAEQLTEIIGKIREKQGATGAKGELQIIPNDANNTIMVLAPESEREKIQSLLSEIDVEPVKGWGEVKLTLFPLLHSKASEMQKTIAELLTSKKEREAAEEMIYRLQVSKADPATGEITELPPIDLQKPTRILSDEGTNSLIVATVEENVVPVGELIRLLDGVPMAEDVGVKLFPLQYADAEKVGKLLKEMFDAGEKLTQDPDGSGQGAVPDSVVGQALVYPVNISTDARSNTLIVSGRQEHLVLVTQVVGELDRPATVQKELRVVTVTERDANDIASTVEEVLKDVFFEPEQRSEYEVTVTALSSNIVLVSALPQHVEVAADLIKQLDSIEEALPQPEQIVFAIKYRKASNVAEQLEEIVTKLREKQGASGDIQIIPNDASNTIMVLAPPSEREKVQALLNGLDVEPVKGWGEVKLTLFPLIHSKANELGDTIEELLKSEEGSEAAEEMIYRLQISQALPSGEILELPPIDLQKPTRIIADEGTNSLIVATVEENVGPMSELIRLLDGVPMAADFDVKFFPLRFADAETIGDLLKEMFDKGKELPEDPDGAGQNAVPDTVFGRALVYPVGIAADVRSNTLVVSGREEHLALVTKVIGELDRPATALKFPLRLIPLEHTDASQIAKIAQELLDQRFEALEATDTGRAALERERVFLSVDIRSNSLIVSASEENYEEILRIAQQLDTRPVRLFDQIRIVKCERLSAIDLQKKIEELWKRKADLRSEQELLEDSPIIVVDERSNSLVIASSIEDYEEIKQLVETLESQPLIDDTRLFKLEYADAAVVADMLDELFSGMAGQSESFEAPTIMPDPRSNALVVAATRDTMERVVDLLKRLDVEAGPLTAVFKVYALRHASAGQLAERVQELFDSREEGTEISRTPIVIMAEESSNSLITSASRDDHEIMVELLGLLDRPSNIARYFEIFPLKMARAATVAEKLESLFQSQAEGSSGRADAIATEADERTNSIIVWASPSQMMNIQEVVARLDTATPTVEMMIKVIQLKQALAEDFAQLLEQTLVGEGGGGDDEQALIVSFMQKRPDGSEAVRKLLRQDIRIEPDPRTNSLMVMAPVDSMNMLEAMIRDFDTVRPIRSEIRLFPLINSDAKTMTEQLTEIFQTEGGDGETQNQLVFGDTIDEFDVASVGQELRFAADPRTNTLITAGAEVDLRMVEELVRFLDSQEAEDRVVEVMQTKYVEPDQIATAVQNFNQQEQDVLGEVDDEEAVFRRMERQVSVEAVGSEEEGGRSLIVGTSRQNYQATMDMIRELDRPEPQVMISVLIAEVALTHSLEFGMEFAGQDLQFSEEAIVGPNGIVQGSNFDYVIGTDLGAAGLGMGGFGFTINGEDFSFLLHALQQNSRLEVLSRPILMVRNGEEGSITVADSVPFVAVAGLSNTGQTQSQVSYEDVGIVLTATPHISPDGYVTIELKQEISSFAGENIQLTEGVSSPVFQTREVDTNVTVRDGETVVIGGLITTRKSEGENKVPILGDLPLIGVLFRSTSVSETKKELMIAMTVDVVRTDVDVRQMSVEQRDKYIESRPLYHHPLLEGLRITPDEDLLGPVDKEWPGPVGPDEKPKQRPDERDLFGPRPEPKTYGPVISRPTQTTTIEQPVYGPKIVRNNEPDTG
ncbi:MAG: secretin N-terminal domain-containing protein [Phycisphaerae bacterium]